MKRKRKCVARSKASYYCDGCMSRSTKCPMRDKYRDLRHTKYGKEKYRVVVNDPLYCQRSSDGQSTRLVSAMS